jgi:hypothetical protein
MKINKQVFAAATVIGLSGSALAQELKFAPFVPPQHTVAPSMIDVLSAKCPRRRAAR